MSFQQQRRDLQEQAHVDKTAGSLLEKLEILRNADIGPAHRRWVWELLQNAVDAARPGIPLDVSVTRGVVSESGEDVLTFIHSGQPFSFKNLVYLVEQVSTKERHDAGEAEPETVGRFGTGFLTTHLLSEHVKVAGVCADEHGGAVSFMLPLDRSGTTRLEIAAAVERAMEVLDDLDARPQVKGKPRTVFAYTLNQAGRQTAHAGLEDLHGLVPYTLAFDARIGCVAASSADMESRDQTEYRVIGREAVSHELELVMVQARCIQPDGLIYDSHQAFVVARGQSVELALPVEKTDAGIRFLPLPSSVPRLHCAFPLVGTERFPFPAVVNSARFHPREERSGIWLGAKETEQNNDNWSLMQEARRLMEQLVSHAAEAEWYDLHVLADLSSHAAYEWLNGAKYDASVRGPLQAALSKALLVETAASERRALGTGDAPGVYVVKGKDVDSRAGLWTLAQAFMADRIPRKAHVEPWTEIAWKGLAALTPEILVATVASTGTIAAWAERLGTDKDGAAAWIGALVSFLETSGNTELLNRAGKGVLPNQDGSLRARRELFVDDEIPEELKDVAKLLGYDIRSELLDQRVEMEASDRETRGVAFAASKIEAQARLRLSESAGAAFSTDTRAAFSRLLRWFHSNEMDAERLFGALYTQRHRLRSDEDVLADMEKAERLDAVEAVLAAHGVDEADLAEALVGRSADPEASADAEKYRHLLGWLQAEGVSLVDLPPLLNEYREFLDQDRRGLDPEDAAVAEFVSELRGQFGDIEMTSVAAFQAFVDSNHELFRHRSEADRYLLFLQKAERARSAVIEYLSSQPERYDVSDWSPCPHRPTVVLGVRRTDRAHGRPLLLVVRPSDGGRVIFYHREELVALSDPEAELWSEDPQRGVQRLTLGGVLQELRDRMGVNQVPVA